MSVEEVGGKKEGPSQNLRSLCLFKGLIQKLAPRGSHIILRGKKIVPDIGNSTSRSASVHENTSVEQPNI
jgi:hypothetical protein